MRIPGLGFADDASALASSTSELTGVAHLDELVANSRLYKPFKEALAARGIKIKEVVGGLSTDEFAAIRKSDGVITIVVDPVKTRFVHLLHEWRHALQLKHSSFNSSFNVTVR